MSAPSHHDLREMIVPTLRTNHNRVFPFQPGQPSPSLRQLGMRRTDSLDFGCLPTVVTIVSMFWHELTTRLI